MVHLLFAIVNPDNEEGTVTNFGLPDRSAREDPTAFYKACWLGKATLKTLAGVECTVGHEYYYTIIISLA